MRETRTSGSTRGQQAAFTAPAVLLYRLGDLDRFSASC